MAEKLKCALALASFIPEGEAWQGDCLFTNSTLIPQNIDGIDYITFQPNKIVYAIRTDSPSFDKIMEAEFGIAFHTIYKDAGNGKKRQYFRVELDRVQAPEKFYLMTVELNASKDEKDYNFVEVQELYEQLKSLETKLLATPDYELLVDNEGFMTFWSTFENKKVADEQNVTLDLNTFYNELWDYVEEKQTKEFQKKLFNLKTIKGKISSIDKWVEAVQEMHDILSSNKNLIVTIVEAFNIAAEIKMHFWNGFKSTYKNDYDQYYLSRTKGYIPADMEGIAMSDSEGNIVKIVDRTTFSSYNRDPDILAGWEHPENKLNM